MSPKKQFEENTFCWRICCGNFYLGFWVNFLALLAGKFEMVNKEMCMIVSDVFFTDFISKIVSFSKTVWIEKKHLRFLAVKIRQCCQKINFHVQKKKISWKTHKSFFDFQHKKLSMFCKKMISNVVKTAFDVCKELNWGKKVLSKNF